MDGGSASDLLRELYYGSKLRSLKRRQAGAAERWERLLRAVAVDVGGGAQDDAGVTTAHDDLAAAHRSRRSIKMLALFAASISGHILPSRPLPPPTASRCTTPNCNLLTDLASNPNVLSIAGAFAAGGACRYAFPGPIGAPYAADANAYDPEAADRFYQARLPVVISRMARLGASDLCL